MKAITQKDFGKVSGRMEELGMDPRQVMKEVSFALQLVNSSRDLQQCDPDSILAAVINIANIGLTLNPASREAYLISRWNSRKKCKEACLQPSYIGLAKLIMKPGKVTSITANVVYEGDNFSIDIADNMKPVTHNPCLIKAKKGERIGFYALATLADGTRQVEWMDMDDIHRIRNYSDGYQGYLKKKKEGKTIPCPWVTDFDEMGRKTLVRRIFKYLPRASSEEQQLIDNAIELDNQEFKISFRQLNKIEHLLQKATITPEQAVLIEGQMYNYTFHQASEAIQYLTENQLPEDVRNGNAQSAKAINASVQDALDDPKR